MIEFINHNNEQVHLVRDDEEYKFLPRINDKIHFIHDNGEFEFVKVIDITHIICEGDEGYPRVLVEALKKIG